MAGAKKIVLPEDGKKNILITSALPYVNNVPHLGNVVGSVLSADVFARFCRARGYQTLYICGTDEYGTATETKALEEGVTPQELCDKYYKIHSEVYEWFNISFDHFGRTPTQQQTDIAQDMFLKLHKNGYLKEETTLQPYCETHNSFLADRFVEGTCPKLLDDGTPCAYPDARGDQCDKCGNLLNPLELINPKCKLDGATPVPRDTTHIFIELDKLQPAITKWFEESSQKGLWSSNGIHITQSWLNEGLQPRGITRDLKWGTKVPLDGYENKVLYVWFDACIGYVSITANYTDQWEKWWRDPERVKLYQFMGKDNVPFHTVIFPGSQIGTGDKWTQLNMLSTTEYLNYEHGKFSKSRGIGVFGTNAKETGIPPDVWRYYLLARRPETSDSEFEWDGFIDANNNELLKNFGNFVNRVIKFCNAKYESVVPDWTKYMEPAFENYKKEVNAALAQYNEELEAVKIRAALATVLRVSSLGNSLLQHNKLDNKLAAEEPDKAAAVIGLALNQIHLLASLVEPYMPETTTSILKMLNQDLLIIPDVWEVGSIEPGHKIGQAALLFSVIKAEKEQEWRELFGGEAQKKAKAEQAAKAAAKKVKKDKKKLAKKEKAAKGKTGGVEAAKVGGVEAAEKGASEQLPAGESAVDQVTKGVEQVVLPSS
ncbi:methionyl-tRNA synthetase [Mytilinidion resinicola]|uniref:methionine--tRNA ligase n=1 Tax=Mytilinidion resinicola TaxID=574789 RepID=A0A6A6YLA0_9PEZI|nr:methionyl-tRNA synthetase [Mytilinidion resinicola]KAF2809656.1 methionyl-tRNA synthetase [Mytilinidion resinicola]